MELASLKNLETVSNRQSRIAIVGIGNPLNGDDGVGSYIAGNIIKKIKNREWESSFVLLAIDAGPLPENHTGTLRRFRPDLVILIDAIQAHGNKESIQWIPLQMIDGFSASTHGMPLSMLAGYLENELNCKIGLIGVGIDPDKAIFQMEVGISPEIKMVANKIIRSVISELKRNPLKL